MVVNLRMVKQYLDRLVHTQSALSEYISSSSSSLKLLQMLVTCAIHGHYLKYLLLI